MPKWIKNLRWNLTWNSTTENKFNGSTYVSQRCVTLLCSAQKVERLNYCIYVSKQKIIGTIKTIDKGYIQIALFYCKGFKWRQLYPYYKNSYGSWFIDKKWGAQPLFKFFFWNSMINSKLESPLCSVI